MKKINSNSPAASLPVKGLSEKLAHLALENEKSKASIPQMLQVLISSNEEQTQRLKEVEGLLRQYDSILKKAIERPWPWLIRNFGSFTSVWRMALLPSFWALVMMLAAWGGLVAFVLIAFLNFQSRPLGSVESVTSTQNLLRRVEHTMQELAVQVDRNQVLRDQSVQIEALQSELQSLKAKDRLKRFAESYLRWREGQLPQVHTAEGWKILMPKEEK